MTQPYYRVLNTASQGFCDFTQIREAIKFYNDGIARGEPYVFCILPELNQPLTENRFLNLMGICTTCLQPFEHSIDEPFADCKCGTTEWAYQNLAREPLLIQLQVERSSSASRPA